MKRICFLVDSIFSIGGVQRVTAVIAKKLAKTYDVTIVTFDHPKDQNLSLYDLHEVTINYRFFTYPQVYTICRLCQEEGRYASLYYHHQL